MPKPLIVANQNLLNPMESLGIQPILYPYSVLNFNTGSYPTLQFLSSFNYR